MSEDVEETAESRWSTDSVTFGEFSFHFPTGFLYRDGQTVLLQQRVTKVLRYLLERPREVVSRDELIDRVWESAHISDASVTEAIKQLRSVLGDDPASPTYIQTIQRRGYRFIAPIREDPLGPAAITPGAARAGLLWDPRLWMAATLLLAIVVVLLLLAR